MRVLVCLAVLLGCALSAGADERLEKLAAGLKSEEQSARYAAYNALNRERSPALIGILVKLLPDCPEMGQYYGMLVLQRQEPKRIKPALRKLLGTSSVNLRVLAAAHLVRLGEHDAAPVIVKALRQEGVEPAQRARLLSRIYGIRDERIQTAVRGLLTVRGPPDVIVAALYNVYVTRDKGARDAVRALDAHPDAGVRAMAGGCLLVLADPDGAARLVRAVGEQGLTSGHWHRLKNMLNSAGGPLPEAVLAAFLEQLDKETDANVIRALVDFLGEQRYARAVGAIRKLLDHANALVSKAAFTALTRFPGAVTPKALRALLEGENDARRLAAAEALRRADDMSGLPVVLAILREGKSDNDRWEAARVLAGFRTSQVVEPLLDALTDEHVSVRANAFSSLRTVLQSLFPYRRFGLASTGYVTTGPEAARKRAAAKIRAWWNKHKDGDW